MTAQGILSKQRCGQAGRSKHRGLAVPQEANRAAVVSTNFLPSWQTVRDFLIAAGVAGVLAAIDYATAQVQAHPLGSAALTAAIVAALGMIRRWVNPTIPVTQMIAMDAPPKLSLDFPTPAFSPAADLGDDNFLSACATQINAYTPAENGKIKSFDPATIIAILSWLFTHREDIAALIERVKTWLGFLFRPKLRKAIVAAAVETGNLSVARGSAPLVDGMESWLTKADKSTLQRVKRIAAAKATQTFE